MRNYLIRRLMMIPFTIVIVTMIIFVFMRIIPGDAAQVRCGASGMADQTCIEGLRERLGLNICDDADNLAGNITCKIEEYGKWITDIVTEWHFGQSIAWDKPVTSELWTRLGNTLQLGLLSIFFSLIVGIPVGVISAIRPGNIVDYIARFFSILALSVPNFWVATLVVYLPAYFWQQRWIPDWTGWSDPLTHFQIMGIAAAVLAVSIAGSIARIARSSMLEVLRSDYVRTAQAKGLRELLIITRHVFRPSMITVFTIAGLQFGLILGGSIIIESIFTINGLGNWIVQAIGNRDFQIIQAIGLLFVTWFVVVTLIIDAGYALIDPRIRY